MFCTFCTKRFLELRRVEHFEFVAQNSFVPTDQVANLWLNYTLLYTMLAAAHVAKINS